jgi:hypothetical protein
MMKFKAILLTFLCVLAVGFPAHAQTGYAMPASTTLSSAQNGSATQLCLTSTTNIFAPTLNVGTIGGSNSGTTTVMVDKELETAIGAPNGNCFQVRRGFPGGGNIEGTGRATSHNSGAVALIGTAAQFFGYVPAGGCTPSLEPILPRVVTVNDKLYNCPSTGPWANTWIVSGQIGSPTDSSGNLDPSTIQFVSNSFTAAQINTMYTTPLLLIPAQTAGTLIEIQSCTVDAKYGSAAFTSGGTITIGYGATQATVAASAAAATIASTFLTTFTASQSITVAGALAVTANTLTLNAPVSITNGSGVFATGTGATVIVDCAYRVHSGF